LKLLWDSNPHPFALCEVATLVGIHSRLHQAALPKLRWELNP
jgi:hypothetical protein